MPTDEQLSEYYDGFLYRKPDDNRIAQLVKEKKSELQRVLGRGGSLKGKTFLDYGGGTGVAYAAATQLGLDVHYFEIDPQASEYVRSRFGLSEERAYNTVEAIPRESFDYIWADNVIEHDPHAEAFLQTMRGLLRPGGEALIKTPRARAWDLWFYPAICLTTYGLAGARYGGVAAGLAATLFRRWNTDPPRHVYSFSPASLRSLASDAGFSEHRVEHYHLKLLEYAYIKHAFKRPGSVRSWVARPAVFAVALAELALKPIQLFARMVTASGAGGVMLRVRR